MYEKMAADAQAAQGAEGSHGDAEGRTKDNVVDADYEVVDEKKK
jgi:molecular chaperone DnaK